jgi:hypothetical protein
MIHAYGTHYPSMPALQFETQKQFRLMCAKLEMPRVNLIEDRKRAKSHPSRALSRLLSNSAKKSNGLSI